MAIESDSVGISNPQDVGDQVPTKGPIPTGPGDVMSLDNVDRALSAKMHHVNDVSLRSSTTEKLFHTILTPIGYRHNRLHALSYQTLLP